MSGFDTDLRGDDWRVMGGGGDPGIKGAKALQETGEEIM